MHIISLSLSLSLSFSSLCTYIYILHVIGKITQLHITGIACAIHVQNSSELQIIASCIIIGTALCADMKLASG